MPIGGIVNCISNLPVVKIDPEDVIYVSRQCYNCWGFTAAILGWIERLTWLEYWQMEKFLKELSTPISEPTIGDIVVFRDGHDDHLTHTALLISEIRDLPKESIEVVHKPGNLQIETSNIRSVYERFSLYGEIYEYRRIKPVLSVPT